MMAWLKKTSRNWFFVVVAVVTFPLIFIMVDIDHGDPLDNAIQKIGFYPSIPPTNLNNPGSFYHVNADGSIRGTVCEAQAEKIRAYMREAPTTKMVASHLQSRGYTLSGQIIKKINSRLGSDEVQSVSYELSNVSVVEISATDLNAIAEELVKPGSRCDTEIQILLRARQFVCQAASVLAATAKYRVDVDDRIAASSNAKTDSKKLQKVASVINESLDPSAEVKEENVFSDEAEINADGSSSRKERVIKSGDNLHYGIKLKYLCMSPPNATRQWKLPGNFIERAYIYVWQNTLY